MKNVPIGSSSISISSVGLTLGMSAGRQVDENEIGLPKDPVAVLNRAAELGINWLDIRTPVGFEENENHLGSALHSSKSSWLVSTGVSLPSGIQFSEIPSYIDTFVTGSMKRLNRDVLDLVHINMSKSNENFQTGWQALQNLKQAGKIRGVGIGGEARTLMPELLDQTKPDYVHLRFNLFHRSAQESLMPYCKEKGIAFIAFGVVNFGLLGGHFTPQKLTRLKADDWRLTDPDFQEPLLTNHLATVEKLVPIAYRYGRPLLHLAITWAHQQPGIQAIIIHARRPCQVEDAIQALNWRLSIEELAEIEQILDQYNQTLASV